MCGNFVGSVCAKKVNVTPSMIFFLDPYVMARKADIKRHLGWYTRNKFKLFSISVHSVDWKFLENVLYISKYKPFWGNALWNFLLSLWGIFCCGFPYTIIAIIVRIDGRSGDWSELILPRKNHSYISLEI